MTGGPELPPLGEEVLALRGFADAPAGHVAKYVTKGINGFWHSLAFTTGRFPDHIRATPRNQRIAEAACQKCHAPMTAAIQTPHQGQEAIKCVRCHDSVGHLR